MVETHRGHVGAQERRYRKLIENIRDSVTVVDASGAPIWTSAGSRGDLGYDSAFWTDANLFDLVHDDDRAEIDQALIRLINDPTTVLDGEVRLREPDDSYRHVGFRAVNKLSDADIAGIVITARPIDHEVRLRHERESRQSELEQALAERARFIADLSHEMRSPLHAIMGLAELIESSDHLEPSLERHVRSISRESQALRVMLDELLDFSKISANRLDLLSEPISPGAIVDAVAESQNQVASAKNLSFSVGIGASVPLVVLGDEHRVRQVLVNLVSNAIKYTDTGTVGLTVQAIDATTVEFAVTDTGPGIPEDAWPTLFEPYRQAREQDTTKGTGLGLVITKRLVELMGGSLTFETSPDGTTFTATIPFAEARRRTDRALTAPDNQNHTPLEVLVVDDSEVNLMLAENQLERLGHQPTTVEGGLAAIELLARRTFDLVLMDWHMPHIDGLETTRRIRSSEPEGQRIPIIATTASVMAGDRETCMNAGMDDYLPKPVSLSDLSTMISRWTPETLSEDHHLDNEAQGIDRLVEELGDPEIVRSVIEAFVAEVPGWRESLTTGTASGDFVGARRAAHTLKSTAQLLGASRLATLGSDFDSTEDSSELSAKLPALLAELETATEQLQTLQSELCSTTNHEPQDLGEGERTAP